MQFLKLPYELITDKSITSNEFRIYTYLMSLYNEKQGCSFPSIEVIAERTTISIATVKRSIKKLVEIGYMVVEKQKAKIGNFNKYTNFKHLVSANDENINSNKKQSLTDESNREIPVSEEVENENDTIKPFIVSDCKESGVQMTIDDKDTKENEVDISEYSIEHQQKIGLVLKQGIKLTEKQEFLIGEMDLEELRKAIHQFKKKKGKYFSLLLSLYIDQAEEAGVYVSRDIEKYLKGSYIRLTPEERETQEALRELELYGVPYGA